MNEYIQPMKMCLYQCNLSSQPTSFVKWVLVMLRNFKKRTWNDPGNLTLLSSYSPFSIVGAPSADGTLGNYVLYLETDLVEKCIGWKQYLCMQLYRTVSLQDRGCPPRHIYKTWSTISGYSRSSLIYMFEWNLTD